MLTNQDKTREMRKLKILSLFNGNEKLYTNQVARETNLVWPTADRLLQELVGEGSLYGDKNDGYYIKTKFMKVKKLVNKIMGDK